MSSKSFFASSRIEHRARRLYGAEEVRVVNGIKVYQVDAPREQVFQRVEHSEIAVCRVARREVVELDEEIEVTALRIKLRRDRGTK